MPAVPAMRVSVALVALALVMGMPVVASAQDDRAAAQERFAAGRAAFDAGDFRTAATAFEEAYAKSPHHDPLWNAARSWHRAGEIARAANLYARYLREAPASARDRDHATAAERELAARLAFVTVRADGGSAQKLDGEAASADGTYVVPGDHVAEATFGERAVRRVITLAAGQRLAVTLEPPEAAPPPPPPPPPPPDADRGFRLPWTVVLASGGLTAIAGGITIWSGLDTLAKRRRFDDDPSQANLDDGKSRQSRTNVALGVTLGLAAVTGMAALLVDWKGKRGAAIVPAFGPTSAGAAFIADIP
jgi:hypothetical protein